MLDAVTLLVVLALVGYVWVVEPVRWFCGRKERPLPDVWP